MKQPGVTNIKKELLSDNWHTLNKLTFSYLKQYSKENGIGYSSVLEQEAQRNLYSYDYVFDI